MRGDRPIRDPKPGLFRHAAVKSAGFRLFGDTGVTLPPSATISASVGILTIMLLASALWIVEVPSRINATGMLMPPDGFLDVVAPEAGQVTIIHAREDQSVRAGQVLFELVAHGKDTNGGLQSRAELQSLRDEYNLLNEILERRRAVFAERRARLSEEIQVTHKSIEFGELRVSNIAEKIAVLEARHARLKRLATAGHIARDTFDRDGLALIEVRASATEAEAALSAARSNLARLKSRDGETRREIELAVAEHEVRREQLVREIKRRESLAAYDVIAPRDGAIARILVKSGMTVKKGQVVAKIFADVSIPEAWIYVSSANARGLDEGETVELQLDAWPAAQFGALTATVNSVSSFVLSPAEVPVPISITGPVFEIRASIARQNLIEQLPGPGTTFKAQIVGRRYRLYQWLTRHLRLTTRPDHA
ncbi:MAG: HlyD family secretion protein [Gammaproteobacteria bacterium]|nr:HlyD family secretion protein [Gammaproteobacteria bacterium]